MGTAFREACNIQLRHWLIVFATAVLVKKFGFCSAFVDYLSAANLDVVAIAIGIGASARGVWIRWRHKAEIKVAAQMPMGSTETAVKLEMKDQGGVLASLKS